MDPARDVRVGLHLPRGFSYPWARRMSTAKTTRATKKRAENRKSAAPKKMAARRDDFGAPIEGFFAKQPPHLRAILEELRKLVEEAAPKATASLKWGMPFYSLGEGMGGMLCALGGHREHVNLILPGEEGTYADPDGRLEGSAKSGKHLKLRSLDELPKEAVRAWLRTAVTVATKKRA